VASDEKKISADSALKPNTPSKDKSTAEAAPPKAESGERGPDSSSSYSRGEGQKPVTQAYKDNWNLIFAKKKR
jgi:hypothetical protein